MYTEKAFHAAILLYYAVVNHYVVYGTNNAHRLLGRSMDDVLVNRMIGGSPTYYTCWNLTIQELYFFLRMVEHLLKFLSIAGSEGLRRWTRMILSVFLAPGSCAVVFLFWSVYAFSPGLVYGDFLDEINPAWVNHAIHTNVALIAVLELYLRAQSDGIWNGGFIEGALRLAGFLIFYTIMVLIALLVRGYWPYPLMDSINCYSFLPAFLLGLFIFELWYSVCYFIGNTFQERELRRRCQQIKRKNN